MINTIAINESIGVDMANVPGTSTRVSITCPNLSRNYILHICSYFFFPSYSPHLNQAGSRLLSHHHSRLLNHQVNHLHCHQHSHRLNHLVSLLVSLRDNPQHSHHLNLLVNHLVSLLRNLQHSPHLNLLVSLHPCHLNLHQASLPLNHQRNHLANPPLSHQLNHPLNHQASLQVNHLNRRPLILLKAAKTYALIVDGASSIHGHAAAIVRLGYVLIITSNGKYYGAFFAVLLYHYMFMNLH